MTPEMDRLRSFIESPQTFVRFGYGTQEEMLAVFDSLRGVQQAEQAQASASATSAAGSGQSGLEAASAGLDSQDARGSVGERQGRQPTPGNFTLASHIEYLRDGIRACGLHDGWKADALASLDVVAARVEQAEKALARVYELTDGSDISAGRDEAVTLRYRLVAIEEVVAPFSARGLTEPEDKLRPQVDPRSPEGCSEDRAPVMRPGVPGSVSPAVSAAPEEET